MMAKKIAFLTLHGMGTTDERYYVELRDDLVARVGEDSWRDHVHFDHIYYQGIIVGLKANLG